MILLTLLLAAVGLIMVSWLKFTRHKGLLELDPVALPDDLPGLISVIVPMRNEENNVDRCLAGLRAQSHAQLEFIVVDDCSTDHRSERLASGKAAWPKLQILRLDEREDRWAGKSYALHRGVERSSGDWLLFVDADVALAPDAVARIVATAQERRWPVVSVIGKPASSTLWERAIVCRLLSWLIFYIFTRPDITLLGACILIRRSLYDKVGGHSNNQIRQSISEDAALGRALSDYGVQPRTLLWRDAYGLKMYATLGEALDGLTRVFSGGGEYKFLRICRAVAAIGVYTLLPLVCLVSLLAFSRFHDRWSIALLACAGLATAGGFGVYLRVLNLLGVSRAVALTKPFGDFVQLLAALNAAMKCITGGNVTWKGRKYTKSFAQGSRMRAPAMPSPHPRPIPRGCGLSLVIPAPEGTDGGMMDQFLQMAARYPDLELILVKSRGACLCVPKANHLRVVDSCDSTAFGLLRHGFLASRGHVVGFLSPDADYNSGWMEALINAFDDPRVQMVSGKTLYEGDTPLAKAASMRDWAQYHDLSRPVPRISASNFAARREILDRYEFGRGFRERGGFLILATQAAMDGAIIGHAPEMVCRLRNPYLQSDTAVESFRAQHELASDVLHWGMALIDYPPFGAHLFSRFLPLIVSSRLSTIAYKNFPALCWEAGIEDRDRGRVFRSLFSLGFLSYTVALRDVLRPQRGSESVCGCPAQIAATSGDPEDPTRRSIYRVVNWYTREFNREF